MSAVWGGGEGEGRSVPLPELAANHRSVQLSIRRLLSRYRSNEHVSFLLLHNAGAKGMEGSTLVIAEDELAPNGALHYVRRHADDYAQVARQVEALDSLEG